MLPTVNLQTSIERSVLDDNVKFIEEAKNGITSHNQQCYISDEKIGPLEENTAEGGASPNLVQWAQSFINYRQESKLKGDLIWIVS